jgi:hypothetical protein
MGFDRFQATSVVLTLVLLLAALSALSGDARAQEATITGITDAGVDEDGDGAYEALSLRISLEVTEEGDFFVTGTMLPSGLDESASVRETLGPGTHTVELLFDGGAIEEAGIDGPYDLEISLFFQQKRQEVFMHRTGDYLAGDFGEPAPDTGASSFEYDGRTVQVEYQVLKVDIDVISPRLTFYYTTDGGENAKFAVEYTELVAYDDVDGDGFLGTGDTVKGTTVLADVAWSQHLYTKSIGSDTVLKAVELGAMVPLDLGDDGSGLVSVTFYYPTSHDESNTHSQRKFDITLEYPEPLDADSVALRHVAMDLTGDHQFLKVGSGEEFTRLEFVEDGSGELHGFYEWTPTIELTSGGGDSTSSIRASAVQGTERDEVTLEFNYPARGLGKVYHDPVVGVNPDVVFSEVSEKAEEILHSPAVYLAAMLVAAVLVFVPLLRKK